MKKYLGLVPLVAAVACPAIAADPKPAAQYWMSVATDTGGFPGMGGMPGMGGAGGADQGLGALLGGIAGGAMGGGAMGGESGPSRTLLLQLVGPGVPSNPDAKHDIPPAQRMGPSIPLDTPRTEPVQRSPGRERSDDQEPPEPPKGRILLYWGCSETVRPGQPRVLDLAKAGPSEYMKIFSGRSGGRAVPPGPRKGFTYGTWPNQKKPERVPADASLVGDHKVAGNYTPDIPFRLDERRDFMAPVEFTKVEGSPKDTVRFEWRSIPTATGYFMMAMGSDSGGNDMVYWSSSEVPEPGWALMDYLPNSLVDKYIKEKVVLEPSVTRCAIPKGVFGKSEGGMLRFIAYGDELNLAHPPRPKDPNAPWNPIWTAKVRLKSTGMLMLAENEVRGVGGSGGRSYTSTPRRGASEPKPQQPASPVEDAVEGVKKLKGLFGF